MILAEPHHGEIGGFLGLEPPIERSAWDIHSPKLPIDGITAELERMTRDRAHERATRSMAVRVWLDVEIAEPQAPLPGMCLEAPAHERVTYQSAGNLGDPAIEPSIGSAPVADKVGWRELGFGVADR